MSNTARGNSKLLADYGKKVLSNFNAEIDAALTRRQVTSSKIVPLESVYEIYVTGEDEIDLNSIQAILKKQIEAVAKFLRDFHIAINGQRTSIFQLYEVEIQVKQAIKSNLSFSAGKLLVQLPYWQILIFQCYLQNQELKKCWNQGKHLSRKSPIRRIWWWLNPLGEFRYNLRETLFQTGAKQVTNIDKLLSNYKQIDVADEITKKDWQSHAIALLQSTIDEDKLGINVSEICSQQDEETLARLLDLYQQNLTDPSYLETLIDTGINSIKEAISQEKSQINVKMFGFVNVGNYHRIDVELNISPGNLKKYIELVPREVEIRAVFWGFVNIYTVDDVTVNPNIQSSLQIDLETAAFERSLQDLQLI
ncbi:MAG: hypothetical protein SAL07_03000 [Oscillatoria sp. PMC 1051.18]|nr:hypothetical protein [Oscillatoria sp. PMC 1050.18]MEC5028856.1 hypothetical protein [Oscillatoria sp. PMC 1051.18]